MAFIDDIKRLERLINNKESFPSKEDFIDLIRRLVDESSKFNKSKVKYFDYDKYFLRASLNPVDDGYGLKYCFVNNNSELFGFDNSKACANKIGLSIREYLFRAVANRSFYRLKVFTNMSIDLTKVKNKNTIKYSTVLSGNLSVYDSDTSDIPLFNHVHLYGDDRRTLYDIDGKNQILFLEFYEDYRTDGTVLIDMPGSNESWGNIMAPSNLDKAYNFSLSDYIKMGFGKTRGEMNRICALKNVDFEAEDDKFYADLVLNGKLDFYFAFGKNRHKLKDPDLLLKCIKSPEFNRSPDVGFGSGVRMVDGNINLCFNNYGNILTEDAIDAIYELIHSSEYAGNQYIYYDPDKFKRKVKKLVESGDCKELSDSMKLFIEMID